MGTNRISDIAQDLEMKKRMERPLCEWRDLLSKDVNRYVLENSANQTFFGRAYNDVNFSTYKQDTAKQIIVDTLYYMLSHKYFKRQTDEINERITEIVKACTENLNRFLIHCSLGKSINNSVKVLKPLPNSCVAFSNGVYDFQKGDWLFKYIITASEDTCDKAISYPMEYQDYYINWCIHVNFEPFLGKPVRKDELPIFIDMCKEMCKSKDTESKCFELVWNMSHNPSDVFSIDKFKQLCETMGFCLYQGFLGYFVLLIGNGGNGKNSLFDGCFSNYRLTPMATRNTISEIENDKFTSGNLIDTHHNFAFENDGKTYEFSSKLKDLTGSEYQQAEKKGVDKMNVRMNIKFMFSSNDQDTLKFADTSNGLERRINVVELYWRYDKDKKFLLRNDDYYDTTFSQDNHELTDDEINTMMFCYLGMYGIANATDDWTKDFRFSYNDFKPKYKDVNSNTYGDLSKLTYTMVAESLITMIKDGRERDAGNSCRFADPMHTKLFSADTFKNDPDADKVEYVLKDVDTKAKDDDGNPIYESGVFYSNAVENGFWISIKMLGDLVHVNGLSVPKLRKLYPNMKVERRTDNLAYIKRKVSLDGEHIAVDND